MNTALVTLTDEELIARVKQLSATERRVTAALIRSLIEFDARRLYLGQGSSSLFTYCTQVLHLAEAAAYNRIEAARAARRFPIILELLEDGALTLTSVRLLAPRLTTDNHLRVLASARHKSKREVELLVATLNPRPDARSVVRKLPSLGSQSASAATGATSSTVVESATAPAAPELHANEVGKREAAARAAAPASTRSVVAPLAPERYKVQITISCETHDKLRRVQDLLRHSVPSGDPAEIFDRALTLLLEDLERRRCAAVREAQGRATPCPRAPRASAPTSRHIPAAVRREVWKRDEGRCAFVGAHGRCTERGFLEFHHVQPYAAGGAATVGNVQLRCRAHNAYEATLFFGSGESEVVREERAAW